MKTLYAAAFAILASSAAAVAEDSPSDRPIATPSYVVPFQQPTVNSPKAIRARLRNDQISAIVMHQRATGEYRARPTVYPFIAAAYPAPAARYIYMRPPLFYPAY